MKYNSFLLILFTNLIFIGCGSQKTAVKKFYMIEPPGAYTPSDSLESPIIDAGCEVERTEVYPAYNSRQIVFRDKTHQIRYFGDHLWAVRPSDALTPLIIDFFSAKRVFTRISDRFWDKSPSYRIESTIFNIEVGPADKKAFETHLKLRFDLIDIKTDKIIISHHADRTSVLEDKNLNQMAASISSIFQEELETFSEMIIEQLAKPENK